MVTSIVVIASEAKQSQLRFLGQLIPIPPAAEIATVVGWRLLPRDDIVVDNPLA